MAFNLGTIVSLKSNGLLQAANYHFLHLGGNENFTTPLMIVVEVLFGTQPEIDEETGEEKEKKKGKDKYKCCYFSNKTMKFEETWFDEKELIMYDPKNALVHNNPRLGDIQWGDIVRFKTVDFESTKKKSFNDGEKRKGTKPLVTFTCPALQVIGFKNVDKKEPIIDSYNGEKKREKSKKLVKCKFFDVERDKFSEQLVSIECLEKIDNSKLEDHLETISKLIANNELSLVELESDKYFGRPISVHVMSGRYQLVFRNELTKKNEMLWIDQIQDFELIELEESKYYPGIHETNDEGEKFFSVNKYIEENQEDISLIKIVYRNLKEEIVSRYISVTNITETTTENDNNNNETYYYLTAHCFLREAERFFRSDRVLSIRTVKNENLIKFLTGQWLLG